MKPRLILALLFTVCFAMTGKLEPWYQSWRGNRGVNALGMLIGDSRKLFANHFFAKADAYFHSGYYPSIFDQPGTGTKSHLEKASSDQHSEQDGHHEEGDESPFLEPPQDWVDAFGRNFYPSHHTHLEKDLDEREILPWLRLTAELDPQKIENYLIASFTLRQRLGKFHEAEQFLREGWRANPDSYEILFELGRVRDENYKDSKGARNLWELALKKWLKQAANGEKPDEFVYAQILGYLGRLEEREGNWEKAIGYFQTLEKISPFKDDLEKRIIELKAKLSSSKS